ncbi:hypothetical protein RUM44_006294 [Polyplax serrata]|uniref:Uncharacterized protein n=1 Tax=Polyplax serrata TaxID=468196 RepID=A0ABR1AHQ0_POLSC
MIFSLFLVALTLLRNLGEGLRCYTCSYDEKDTIENLKCVTEPWNLTGNSVRTCLSHVQFCIIVRVENKETGRVTSFLRKCEENPLEDSDVDSTAVIAHYRSCSTDLCNKGDGLNFVDEGFEGDSVALLVPDKSFAVVNVSSAFIKTEHLPLSIPFVTEESFLTGPKAESANRI